jgi:hypothetical protein
MLSGCRVLAIVLHEMGQREELEPLVFDAFPALPAKGETIHIDSRRLTVAYREFRYCTRGRQTYTTVLLYLLLTGREAMEEFCRLSTEYPTAPGLGQDQAPVVY